MKYVPPSALGLLLLAPPFVAQTPGSHADSGQFRQPTPADRYRQDAALDNLVHPAGYVTAPPGTFGDVVEKGEGATPVILLAGLGPGWRVFSSFIDAHLAEYHFYCVTLAGYGGSSAPPMPAAGTGFEQGTWLAGGRQALARLVQERELEAPLLVAFYSDAAHIATRYAIQNPDALGGLLILSASARFPLPPGAPRGPSLDGFADSWFRTVTEIMWPSGMWPTSSYAEDSALSEKTWWDVLQPSLPTAIRYTVETWADDLVPDLSKLRTACTVLSPGFDEEFLGTPTGQTIRQRFHGGWEAGLEAGAEYEHVILPGARLLLWEDQPDEVALALQGLAEGRALAPTGGR